MWGIRNVVGPWAGNLPHAGGIGLSIIQSAADAALVVAIWNRFGSLALALAITLLIATAPEDMSLSASIWNPPLAVAFVKMSIAFSLVDEVQSLWRVAAATAAALLAVQSHSSAVFFAVPAILGLTGREIVAGRRTRALRVACISAAVVLLLETPYLLDFAMNRDRQTSPAVVVANVSQTIEHPETLRPRAAFYALVTAWQAILIQPWAFGQSGIVLVACAIAAAAAFRTRHDLALACVTIVPLLAAVAGFSFWQGVFEFYWFMTLMPSTALTVALALTAWKPATPVVAGSLLFVVLAAQPARLAYSQLINRLPTYGASGSRLAGDSAPRRRDPPHRHRVRRRPFDQHPFRLRESPGWTGHADRPIRGDDRVNRPRALHPRQCRRGVWATGSNGPQGSRACSAPIRAAIGTMRARRWRCCTVSTGRIPNGFSMSARDRASSRGSSFAGPRRRARSAWIRVTQPNGPKPSPASRSRSAATSPVGDADLVLLLDVIEHVDDDVGSAADIRGACAIRDALHRFSPGVLLDVEPA